MSTVSPPSKRTAFTLIEIMVAVTILSLLASFILAIIGNTAKISTQTSSRLDSNRVARECLDLIGRDLCLTSLPYNRTDTTSLQLVINPPKIASTFANPHSIFWQAPIAKVSTNGNLAEVGYYLLRDLQTDPKKNRLQLRRLYIEPEPAASTTKYLIYSAPTDWITDDLLAAFGPSTAALDNQNAQKGWVADGVIAMWIRCLDSQGNPISQNAAKTTTNYAYDSRTGYYSSPYQYPATSYNNLPPYIEIALVCTSAKDVERITQLPTPSPATPSKFYEEIDAFTQSARQLNPQIKSIDSFSRVYRIYGAN